MFDFDSGVKSVKKNKKKQDWYQLISQTPLLMMMSTGFLRLGYQAVISEGLY